MTTSGTVEPTDSGPATYHIVCHDCATEFLTAGEEDAERRLSEHRSATGHNVEFAALDGVRVERD